jgi:hypothetical protein
VDARERQQGAHDSAVVRASSIKRTLLLHAICRDRNVSVASLIENDALYFDIRDSDFDCEGNFHFR